MEFLSGNFLIETIVPKEELIVSRTDLKEKDLEGFAKTFDNTGK